MTNFQGKIGSDKISRFCLDFMCDSCWKTI